MKLIEKPKSVRELLRMRAQDFPRTPTPEALAASLTVERFPDPVDPTVRRLVTAFRHLRTDARVQAARAALRCDS